MKISTFKCGNVISKALIMLLAIVATTFGVHAQTGSAPQVTNFYPSVDAENPETVHANTSMYVYFDMNVSECTAQVLQDGNVIGNLTFVGKAPAKALPAKKDMIRDLLDGSKIKQGNFVVKPVSVTYLNADGDQVKYEDTEGKWLTATYYFGGEAGKVVSETEFPNKTLKSWYPDDADEGVKTITFNKPLKPGMLAVLEYGNGESSNNFARIPVRSTLSEDGKTLTIDLRGRLHNVDTMVPNAHFVDENGNPVAPPTVISLSITDLYTVEGQPVIGVYTDPVSGSQLQLTANLYYSYNFRDLTLTTPRITSAKFEGSNLTLTLADYKDLNSADVVFVGQGDVLGVVPEVTISSSMVSVPVPADVDINSVASVRLDNAVYKVDDGVNHVIRPYNIKGSVVSNDLTTIAAVKALGNKEEFSLVCDGLKVTYSNPQEGYIFIEDESGAVQVDPECGFAPAEGTIITGTLKGSYYGEGLVAINPAKSEYEATAATIQPTDISLEEILDPVNNYRLIRVELDGVDCAFSDEDNLYWLTMEGLDVPVLVVIDLIGEPSFQAPRNVKEVTGIAYCIPFTEEYMIVVRHTDDIVEGSSSSISTIAGDADAAAPVYTVGGVKVREAGQSLDGLSGGVYIIGGKKVMVK